MRLLTTLAVVGLLVAGCAHKADCFCDPRFEEPLKLNGRR